MEELNTSPLTVALFIHPSRLFIGSKITRPQNLSPVFVLHLF